MKGSLPLTRNILRPDFHLLPCIANDPRQSPGDSFDEMAAKAKKKQYYFPYLVDETQEVAKSFGATNTPHVFVLQKNGNDFKVAYIGTIDITAETLPLSTKRSLKKRSTHYWQAGPWLRPIQKLSDVP